MIINCGYELENKFETSPSSKSISHDHKREEKDDVNKEDDNYGCDLKIDYLKLHLSDVTIEDSEDVNFYKQSFLGFGISDIFLFLSICFIMILYIDVFDQIFVEGADKINEIFSSFTLNNNNTEEDVQESNEKSNINHKIGILVHCAMVWIFLKLYLKLSKSHSKFSYFSFIFFP